MGDEAGEDFQDGFDRLRVSDLRRLGIWRVFRSGQLERWQRIVAWVIAVGSVALFVLLAVEHQKGVLGWVFIAFVIAALALIRDLRAWWQARQFRQHFDFDVGDDQ